MSIIQTIRDKAAVLVFAVIAISLIGFLVQDAFVGRTSSLFSGPSSTLGSVNGESIDRAQFEERIRMAEQAYQAQGAQLDEGLRQNIYNQVWNSTVETELVNAEINKLGITFTPKEMSDLLFSDRAPNEFKQQFMDPQTGIYNVDAARTAFRNIQTSKNVEQVKMVNDQLIEPITLNQLRLKYVTLIAQSSYVPKWLVERSLQDNSAISNISYTGQAYATIADSTIKITDDEINKWISDHKDDFKQEKSRSVSYVLFDATASSKDSSVIRDQFLKLKSEFIATDDSRMFITRNQSSMPYFDGYVLKSRMQMANKDSIASLPVGGVFGPYVDANSMVLAKKVATRNMADSVKCRHILVATVDLQTGAPKLSDSAAKKRADSIASLIRGGGDFSMLALQFSDDGGSKLQGGEIQYSSVDFGSIAPEFAEAIFYGNTGDKKVVKTQFGYHYVEVMNQKNVSEAYKIAYLSKSISASDETDNTASAAATKFSADSRNLKAFEENISKGGYNKRLAEEVKEMDFDLPGVGVSRSLVRWIFDNEVGAVSDPFPMKDHYVVVAVTDAREEGLQKASSARTFVEPVIRNKKKAEMIAKKVAGVTTLEEAAGKLGTQVNRADSVRFAASFVPGVGAEPKLVGASFNKAFQGKISTPIEGQAGVYFIRVEEIGATSSAVDVEQQRRALQAQQKQFAGYGALQALRTAATVKDDRRTGGY